MYKNIKRLMDIILSIIGIVICAIPMLIVAVIIKLDSPGPVFFRQARRGLHGKEFKILKFRSMCVNAEFTGSGVYSGKSDSRVTRVGKIIRATSIDEIPQLFNVLAGSMSFIGPRPPLTYHPWPIEEYTEEQRKISEINTGIYCFDNQALFKHLEEIRNDNAQQEYYITDLVEIFNRHGLGVKAKIVEDSFEASGVNDKKELAQATRWMQTRINEHWMEEGVALINPDSTYIGPDVVLGKDVTLYPNVYLEGNTVINDGTTILPQSFLVNAVIGKNRLLSVLIR